MLDSSPPLDTAMSPYGSQTKRIHVGPYTYPGSGSSVEEHQENITGIIRHCPNVELFIIERQLGSSLGPIMDALVRHASGSVHTIYLNIAGESVSNLILGLSALPRIISAHINVETSDSLTNEAAYPGQGLPYLQQILLRGYVATLLKQLGRWDLPLLCSLSLESCTSIHNPPDVEGFLRRHGTNLVLLDLKTYVNVPLILDLCPNLHTFIFNADWRIEPHNGVASTIVNQPHQQLITVGLHGLWYSFGVGTRYLQATTDSAFDVAYSNDLNMAALNKHNFPKLRRIRAVNQYMLEDLKKSNGPSTENDGYNRWCRWRLTCKDAGIRLEDCTSQLLGGEEDSDEEAEDENVEA